MALTVEIAGVDRTANVKAGSVSIAKVFGETWTADFGTFDPDGIYYPNVGEEIYFRIDGTIYWGGIIRRVERNKDGSYTDVLETSCSCTDWNHILERRLAGEYEWINETAGNIIRAINGQSLTGEGFSDSLVQDGPVIANFRVNYGTVAEAYAELSKLAPGFRFHIDQEKNIVFGDSTASPPTDAASFDIPVAAGNISYMSAVETDEDYANFVVARAQKVLREPQTEKFNGDGTITSFQTAFQIALKPTITLEFGGETFPQTVGIASVDVDKDWYWAEGSTEIRQDPNASPLVPEAELSVTYVGIEQIFVLAKNEDEIATRAAIEGGSGRHEKFLEIDTQITRADAQDIVDGYLYEHLGIPLVVTYKTNDWLEAEARNLQVGTIQSILQDGWAAQQTNYFIRSIKVTQEDISSESENCLVYEVEAIWGKLTKTVYQWFRALAQNSSAPGARLDNQTEWVHFFLAGCEELAAGTDIAPHRPHLHNAGTIYQFTSDFKTPPTSDVEFEILRSTNAGASYTRIHQGDNPKHPANTEGPVLYTAIGDGGRALPEMTKFRIDVVSGGGMGWALKIAVKPIVAAPGQMAGDGANASGIEGNSEGTPLVNTTL